jgi:hypothetical protein
MSKLEITYIPIEKIRLNCFNVNQLSASTFEDLKTSVLMHGLKQPLTVRPLHGKFDEGFFELVDGQHRMIIIKEKFDEFTSKFGYSVPCVVNEMDEEEAEKTVFMLTHTRGEYNQGKGSEIFEGREDELAEFTGINPLKIFTYTSPPILFTNTREVDDSILQYITLYGYNEKFLKKLYALAKGVELNYYEKDNKLILSCVLSAIIKRMVDLASEREKLRDEINEEAMSLKGKYDEVFHRSINGIRIRKFSRLEPILVENVDSASAKCKICEKKGCQRKESYDFTEKKCFFCVACHDAIIETRNKKKIEEESDVNRNIKRMFEGRK